MKTATSELSRYVSRAMYAAALSFLFFPLLAQTGGSGAPAAADLQLKTE